MFGNRVPPGVIGSALAVLAGAALLLNWPEPKKIEPGGSQGSNYVPFEQQAKGIGQVRVETLAGDEPGYADGPLWKARFCGPTALALEPDGSLLVCDSRNHRLRRVSPAGEVTTVAGGGDAGGTGGRADGAALAARFRYPAGVAVGSDGTLYIADTGNHRICALRGGMVRTLAGAAAGSADGSGAAARFSSPAALTLGPDGALWVADAGNRKIRRVTAAGQVSTPQQVPAAVRASLGDCEAPHRSEPVVATTVNTDVSLSRTRFTTASRAFSGGVRFDVLNAAGNREAPRLFADFKKNVLLMDRGKGSPVLLAGVLDRNPVGAPASIDGRGDEARFVGPCAVVAAPDGTAYVAEYEGNRIRRVYLSEPLLYEVAHARINAHYTD